MSSRKFSSFHFLGVVLLLAASVVFSACSDDVPLIAVQVNPLCVAVGPGGSQQYNATIFINGVPQAPDPDNSAVTWSVSGGDVNGIISNSTGTEGQYVAPNTVPPPAESVMIIATSKEDDRKAGQATAFLAGDCPDAPPFSIKF